MRDHRKILKLLRSATHASAFGLRGYVDTLSSLVAMLLLDRSYVIVGILLKYYVPQQASHLSSEKKKTKVDQYSALKLKLFVESL